LFSKCLEKVVFEQFAKDTHGMMIPIIALLRGSIADISLLSKQTDLQWA
jgi:hypothetical protein